MNEVISLSALQKGDRQEFAKLADLYSGPIYHLGLRFMGNEQDAEDVLQETFVKAFRAIHLFKGQSSLSTWLYRIATNEALMILRKRKPENQTLEIDKQDEDNDDGFHPVQIKDWCCLPEAEFLNEETKKTLNEAILELTPALRSVFLLRDVEGLSVRETAENLSISEMAVKTRLSRARFILREILSKHFLRVQE